MKDKLLLRPDEAAGLLSVGRSKTYELIAQGEIPCVRIGRSVRIPTEALRRWIDERAAVATNDNGSKEGTDVEGTRPIRRRA